MPSGPIMIRIVSLSLRLSSIGSILFPLFGGLHSSAFAMSFCVLQAMLLNNMKLHTTRLFNELNVICIGVNNLNIIMLQ